MRNPSAVFLLVIVAALFVYFLQMDNETVEPAEEETVTPQNEHNFDIFNTYVRPKYSPSSINARLFK